ncbi:dipeptidyl aminopeptidase 3, putative [Plasmodium relictum]|uniref:Dipeptidyl peptidase 1 n=1 Tax=Plasmodium relictum TaxID=85471 RepID=A0A1J1H0P4_PLARL|nr:dipeptidyl aminopeptidase 3, putative [Plasmodium relictum]CRG98535.1 dipeptidyl aminopeptidase 3, putative [Plasmodium relictum]
MIFILFFFLIFLNYIKCDVPVHCLSRHVEGKWEIKLGLLKNKNSESKKLQISKKGILEDNLNEPNYDYECGYRRPDNSDFHDYLNPEKIKENFEEKKKKVIVFNNDRTINIIENNHINYKYNGYWRIIYDEALYIEIYKDNKKKEIYFSFFKFKEKGDVSYSYCNNLIIGIVNIYYLNYNYINKGRNFTSLVYNSIGKNKNINFIKYNNIKKNLLKNRKNLNSKRNDLYVLNKNVNYSEIKYVPISYKSSDNYYNIFLQKKKNKKIIKEKYFYELIDYYNDNFINFNFLTMDRYCWYGKKLSVASDMPTNKIPSDIVSPLVVDVNMHNKNYEMFKLLKEEKKDKNQEKNVGIIEEESEELNEEKKEGNNIFSLNLFSNNISKKFKKNRLLDIYDNKNITLSNFDWTNEGDVRKRLGNFIKIVDNAIDQKNCGSCYANSAALIINSRLRIKYNYIKNIDFLFFSKEQLLICDYFNQGCSGGYIYISLKYAYENFLYTDKCFKRYMNKYINKDEKNNFLCDRFDTFKIFLHKRNDVKKEEKDSTFVINMKKKKKKKFLENLENIIIENIKLHNNSSENELKNDVEKTDNFNNVEVSNSEINEKKENENDYGENNDDSDYDENDYDDSNNNDDSDYDENDYDDSNNNDDSDYDENDNDDNNNDDSDYDENDNDDNNNDDSDERSQKYDEELNEDYILMNKKIYEKNKLDFKYINSCDVKIKVRKFEYLDIEDEENLKKYIYYNGPIAAAIEPSKEFFRYKKGILKENFIKMHDGNKSNAYIWNKVDHAVVIVGWGEDTVENFMKENYLNDSDMDDIFDIKEKEKNKIIKYWKILNSWGTNWGNNGYFYILRDQNYYNIKSYLLLCDVNLFIKKSHKKK